MNAQKRLLPLLLALCMVLALVPAAFAEDGPAYLDPETELSDLIEEEGMGDARSVQVSVADAGTYSGTLTINGQTFNSLSGQTFTDLTVGEEYIAVFTLDQYNGSIPENLRGTTWYCKFTVPAEGNVTIYWDDFANAATYYTVTFTFPNGLTSATVNGRTITASDSDLNLGAGDYTVVADGYDAFPFTVSADSSTHTVDLSEWTPSNSGGEGDDSGDEPNVIYTVDNYETGWVNYSPIYKIPVNGDFTIAFQNKTNPNARTTDTHVWANWFNFVLKLYSTPANAVQKNEEFEYLRADYYGSPTNNPSNTWWCNFWDQMGTVSGNMWDNFQSNMTNAKVTVRIINNDNTVTVYVRFPDIKNTAGYEYGINYMNISKSAGDLYFRLTSEQSSIEMTDLGGLVPIHAVTFNANGGTEDSVVYAAEGESIDLPTVTRNGFSFEGWYIGETKYENSYTVGSDDATLIAKWNTPVGGYLYTSNAVIKESLMWSVYFAIDTTVIANPATEAKVTVTGHSEAGINNTYTLTYESTRKAYYITVPIRPRLINEEVTFSLVSADGSTTYPISIGEGGKTANTVSYTFNDYLTQLEENSTYGSTYSGIVAALRDYRDALLDVWPATAN